MVKPSSELEAVAADLLAARRDRRSIPPIRSRLSPGDIEAAYAVQDFVTAQASGTAGRKIGLTSPAAQARMGVREPNVGTLSPAMAVEGRTIPLDRFIAPFLEGEVAFRVGRDIDTDVGAAALAAAIDGVATAFEVVDSAITGWDVGIVDVIADNACCAGFMTGPWQAFTSGDALLRARMSLAREGVIQVFGGGDACPGGPLAAFGWLAAKAIAMGRPLRAGEVVLAGSLAPMVPLEAGRWTLRVDGFAPLRLRVATTNENDLETLA
ncbi:MAG: 2-keto-4-pentenoate hydratase [Caulobacter sp.]|nr:2-keto-4-pentenoate hydratase [Caulobacter sp.]